jgi:hypothetical protein
VILAVFAVLVTAVLAIAWLLARFDRKRRADDVPRYDDEPSWWPEFERQFSDYVSSRD